MIIRTPCAFALLASAMVFSACGTFTEAPPQSSHPLSGQIYDVRHSSAVTREALLHDLASADFILLGEVHDNLEHHRLQAEILRALIARGRRPALAMEQLDREFQSAVDTALAQPNASADALGDAGNFNRKGWDWPAYAPLLTIAVEARLPVVAINLSRNRTRDVVSQGFVSLGPDAAAALALDRNWTPAQQAIQMREIDEGHCGKLPASAMPKMVDVQRARDARMADALLERSGSGAVVIAGVGHVRNDVGVPVYMASRAPGRRVVSIAFIEVDAKLHGAREYVRLPAKTFPFDYVWFTNAAEREDPCAGFVTPKRL